MSETLFSLLMVIGGVGIFWLGWHLRGEADKPPFTTKPPTSHAQRPSHHIDVKAAPYKIKTPLPPVIQKPWTVVREKPQKNLLEPIALPIILNGRLIDLQAANKRNRERILANMRAGKRNN